MAWLDLGYTEWFITSSIGESDQGTSRLSFFLYTSIDAMDGTLVSRDFFFLPRSGV